MSFVPKSPAEIEGMRRACRLASEVLDYLTPLIKAGVTTRQIDRLAHEYMVGVQDTTPATLGYQPQGYPPYPASLCTSVNDVVCHGIPDERPLKDGDIVNVDVTVIKDGFHGDSSRMFHVGKPTIQGERVARLSREALWLGIAAARPGNRLGDIGHAIQSHVEAAGCSVVREYCGHGIGRIFHEDPQVLHYGSPGQGLELVPGMTFTIEPMVNAGKRHVRLLGDGWTVVTGDHSLSAQWEHTILITPDGHEVLTLGADERP
jgi:methionyl aminopeptidase